MRNEGNRKHQYMSPFNWWRWGRTQFITLYKNLVRVEKISATSG